MRHKILIHISMLAGAMLLLASAPAMAAPGCGSQTVPSGDSQVSQYTETVPGACGDEQTGGDNSSGGGGGSAGGGSGDSDSGASPTGSTVPTETTQDDAGLGAATESSSGSGQSSGSAGDDSGSQGGGQGGGQPADLDSSTTGQPEHANVTPLSDTGTDSDDGGGVGWVVPAILGLTLLGAIAYVVRRRFRNGDSLSSPSGA